MIQTKLLYYTSLILRVQTLLLSSADDDDKTLLSLMVLLSLMMSAPAASATVTSEHIEKKLSYTAEITHVCGHYAIQGHLWSPIFVSN